MIPTKDITGLSVPYSPSSNPVRSRIHKVDLLADDAGHDSIVVIRCLFGRVDLNTKASVGAAVEEGGFDVAVTRGSVMTVVADGMDASRLVVEPSRRFTKQFDGCHDRNGKR
jgi:hypothetical protein